MDNSIARFQISADEDFRIQFVFVGLSLAGRTLRILVKERASNVLRDTLTIGDGLTLDGTDTVTAIVPQATASAWAKGEFETDLHDITGGGNTRLVGARTLYDVPGKLPYGVIGAKATVQWVVNKAIVTAIGGIGPTGPANTLTAGDVTTLPAGQPAAVRITGTAPNQTVEFDIPAGADGTDGTNGTNGTNGIDGNDGWSPIIAVVADGVRRILQVADWTGGEGTKPATGSYIGASGLVTDIASAVDIRGDQGPSGSVTDGDKGDITVSSSGTAWAIDANVVTDAKLRDSAALSVIGRSANTGGDPADIAAATDGHVLRRFGTTLGFGTTATAGIADDAATNAKLANMATATIKGRATAGTGDPEDLTATQATALLNAMVGDSGAGGTKGLAPAPAPGDAAAGKVLGAGGGWVAGSGAMGQCCLVKSGANIVLQPRNGNLLAINGINQSIPSAGVSLAPSGLTPSTLYYIYAYMNAGTMTLEASTTGNATSTSTGVEVKSGDSTRTLVGIARPVSGPAWQDTAAQRFVRSWFNRPRVAGSGAFTAQRTRTNTGWGEVDAEIRVEFLLWPDELVHSAINGYSFNSGANTTYASVGYDGITNEGASETYGTSGGAIGYSRPKSGLSLGYHYATVLGRTSSGTGTYGAVSPDFMTLDLVIG